MTLLLGIDTGGTYTDAVLLNQSRLHNGQYDEQAILASAKSLLA